MSDILAQINRSQNRPRWVKYVDDNQAIADPGEIAMVALLGSGIMGAIVAFVLSVIFRGDQENFPGEFFMGWFAAVAIPLFVLSTMFFIVLPAFIANRYQLRDIGYEKAKAVEKYNGLRPEQQETIRVAFEDLLATDDKDNNRLDCANQIFNSTLEALHKQDKLNFELERLQPRESEHILDSIVSVNKEMLKQVNEYKELSR